MNRWYCKLGGQLAGPFSRDELEFLCAQGQLTPDIEVRREDQRAWSRASLLLSDLFPRLSGPDLAADSGTDPAKGICKPAIEKTSIAQLSAEAIPVALASRMPVPIVPSAPQRETEFNRRCKQVLLGSGIGMLTAAIVFLMLWLLLSFGNGAGAVGVAGRGGQGKGLGTGQGNGSGAGNGGAAKAANSGGASSLADGQSSGDNSKVTGVGQAGESTGSSTGDEPAIEAIPRPQFAIQKFNIPSPPVGGSAAGDGGFLSGGGSDGSEFFGTRARGSKFVYIIDCSGSMAGPKFDKAKAELIASLQSLKPTQSAYVYFFSDTSYPMFSPQSPESKLLKCTKQNVKRMEEWILDFPCLGGTEPRQSLLDALDLKPDAIFFLTDGGFDYGVPDDVRNKNQKKVCINTICFVDPSGEPLMKQIASENRGDYRFVP